MRSRLRRPDCHVGTLFGEIQFRGVDYSAGGDVGRLGAGPILVGGTDPNSMAAQCHVRDTGYRTSRDRSGVQYPELGPEVHQLDKNGSDLYDGASFCLADLLLGARRGVGRTRRGRRGPDPGRCSAGGSETNAQSMTSMKSAAPGDRIIMILSSEHAED